MARKQSPEEVEEEVQARHPHLRLVEPSGYEGKGFPAWWYCALDGCRVQAKASSLIRAGSGGCPKCIETRAFEKRRNLRADPDLEQHLAQIREQLSEDYARTYSLHFEGVKWEVIGAELGISIQGVQGRLRRIADVLSEAAHQATK